MHAASRLDVDNTGRRAPTPELRDDHARSYDPTIGRFIQPDSIIPDATNPQRFNRYSYVRNSPVSYNDPSGHQDSCAVFGACPDYQGVQIAVALMAQVDRGGNDILVAAGIAVQSEWPDINNPLRAGSTSGLGPAQLSRAQLDWRYGAPVPDSEQYGLGLPGEDPNNPSTAVTGMSRRIYQVTNACGFCSTADKLIMAALAQNGGFTLASLKDVRTSYYTNTTGIDWTSYLANRTQTSDPIAKYRAETAGNYIYDSHFMLLLYTNDLLELYRRGWRLPLGLHLSDIYGVRRDYLGLPSPASPDPRANTAQAI